MSLFHHHIWKTTGVNPMLEREKSYEETEWVKKRHHTIVHQVCLNCGDLKTKDVDGTWELAEITDVAMNELKK